MTGDNARAVTLPAEAFRSPAQVAAPPGLDNLPLRPALFVGRTSELQQLDAAMATPGGVFVQAVHGLGGVGKSTLAAHWAATRPHGCAPIRWINADSPTGVQEGLAALATALQPALAQVLSVEELADRALQWLATHTGWLLILDNVNDPADITPLLARAPGGRFLITSRLATTWHHLTTVVRLDVLGRAEALDLLSRLAASTAPGRDMNGAADLCAELGHLPLAVEQAGAYLAQNQFTTPRTYLDLLTHNPATTYDQGAVGTTPERTIARIWRTTLDRISADQPLAADLLRLLAWYAPDQIPATLLDGLVDGPTPQAALGLLTAYSMITPDPATHTLAVHRLVQALARTPDPDDPHRTPRLVDQARSHATSCLHAALPPTWDNPATWPTWHALVPHIDALAARAFAETDTTTTAAVLNRAGRFLEYQGQISRAISHLRRALAAAERTLGPDAPDTLATRGNLAHAHFAAGDSQGAIPLYKQNLSQLERVLGPEHPESLTCRSDLANAYWGMADLERAIAWHERTLTDRMRVLGPDHPDTLGSRHNLATAYLHAWEYEKAIPLYERTLTDRMRVLGPDHPHTLTTRYCIARAYWGAEGPVRAIPLLEQTLTDRVRVLGPDHPDTLGSRSGLAEAYHDAGDVGRSIALFEQVLAHAERVLDPDHVGKRIYRHGLAQAYHTAGNVEQAIPLYERNLTDDLRIRGPDHPDTLDSRLGLAQACWATGDHERSVSLYEENLTCTERQWGSDHPESLTCRYDLANAYWAMRDLERAIPLYEQTFTDRVRVLGPDHPDTLASAHNRARAYWARGDVVQAVRLYEQTLTAMERVLGPDDLTTLVTQHNLALAYESTGDFGQAISLLEQAIAGMERTLDPDHAHTLNSRNVLTRVLAKCDSGEFGQP
ncbi:tetratricopeptide repeat protein [Streptomyces sp. NPDC053750]|uniref:tetratricopeptide repeat protein n=1 Tax=Streptomyces sp. NPDC053750 TaxID=3365714 RepID=UPI0037D55CA4